MKFPLTREPRKKNEKKDKKPYVKYGLSLRGKKKQQQNYVSFESQKRRKGQKTYFKKNNGWQLSKSGGRLEHPSSCELIDPQSDTTQRNTI